MDIRDIIEAILAQRFRVTDHADEEAVNDRLALDDVLNSVRHGEIVEDYPQDKPYPSCLVFGASPEGYPIHSVWAYNKGTRWAVLVTVYRPDPERWTNWRTRKKR